MRVGRKLKYRSEVAIFTYLEGPGGIPESDRVLTLSEAPYMYRKRKNEKCVQIIKRRSVRRRFHPSFMVDEASEKYAQVEMRKDAHVDKIVVEEYPVAASCFGFACSLESRV